MNEKLLQYIWQFQYFAKTELATTNGEGLAVLFAGTHNSNQGPDFINAKVRIDDTLLVGNIELHVKTSDWDKHKHSKDKNYQNIILHVVWENDKPGKEYLPLLELKTYIPKLLLHRYSLLMEQPQFIPCEKNISIVNTLTWVSWKERLLAERMIRKSGVVISYLESNQRHWEETFWWLLARNFGMKVNADAFEAIARSIPLLVLAKIKNQYHQIEALLMGQAGLLDADFTEEYPALLKREYAFLKTKYRLQPINISLHFLRMRPGNFPTIRLAQLAMLIANSSHLFSKIKEANSLQQLYQYFNTTANDYWHYHYRFGEQAEYKKKNIGKTMLDNILINTIAPLLFTYGKYNEEMSYADKAIQWLEELKAERNSITNGFALLGVAPQSAYDSQALIELKNEYCNHKKCLDCGIGNAILKH